MLEHAAGRRLTVKHRDGITLLGKVICAGQACGAGANDGDRLGVVLIDRRHIAQRLIELLVGDEFLDIVDCHSVVHAIAGAFVLAGVRADTAADGGERVFALDDLQRVEVLALARLLDIALNGDVRRALSLAGARALLAGHDAGVTVFIKMILRPAGVAGDSPLRGLSFDGAEGVAHADGVHRAHLHAGSAGDALGRVDVRGVVRLHAVRRLEPAGVAEDAAVVAVAVADDGGLASALVIEDGMHASLALVAEQNFLGLLAADLAAASGADIVARLIANLDLGVLIRLDALIARERRGKTTFAVAGGIEIVLIEIRLDLLVACDGALRLHRLLDGDGTHDTLAHRHGHGLEGGGLGVLIVKRIRYGDVLAHERSGVLQDAGHPERELVFVLAVEILDVHDAGDGGGLELTVDLLDVLPAALAGHLGRRHPFLDAGHGADLGLTAV